MARWVTPTSMPPISSPALRQSQRSARRPGFRTVWFRCSRGSRASITWTTRTLAHAPDWLGTSSATARPLCELVTLWLTTWRIFPPSARLTFSKVPEPGRLQTLTWACSRSQHWGTAARLACSMPRAKCLPGLQNLFQAFGPNTCYNPATNTASPDWVCIGPQAGSGVTGTCAGAGTVGCFQTYGSNPTGTPPFNIFGTVPNLKTPRIQYYNATIQHELFRNNAITVTYLGAHGTDSLLEPQPE